MPDIKQPINLRSQSCLCEYKENPYCVDKDGFQLEGYWVIELNDICPRHMKIYKVLAYKKHFTRVSIEMLREMEIKEARGELDQMRFAGDVLTRFELLIED